MKNYLIIIALFCLTSACESQDILSYTGYSRAGIGYDICIDNDLVYVTNNEGVVIFNIDEPKQPRKVSKIEAGVTFGVCVSGGLAYIASGTNLIIADVTDPSNPEILLEFPLKDETHGIRVDGSIVYVCSHRGLIILDAGNPKDVSEIAHYGDQDMREIEIRDGIAYIACPQVGVEVIDVRNLLAPVKIATLPDTERAWDVHIHENQLYVGCHASGIAIFRISENKIPEKLGVFRDDDGGEATGVWGNGKLLFVEDNSHLEILDISDPANPIEIAENKRGEGHSLCIKGNYVYIASYRKGLLVFQYSKNK